MPTTTSKLAIFIFAFLCGAFVLWKTKKRFGFLTLYYTVVGANALAAVWVFSAPADALDNFPTLGFALTSITMVLPPVLLVLSLVPSSVPRLIIIPCLVASLVFSLYILVAVTVAGAGIVG